MYHRREFFNLKKVLLATLATIGIFGLSTFTTHAEEVQTDNGKTIYRVEQGDTLSSIGVKYRVDYSEIYRKNKDTLKSAHLIFVGDKLEIPKGHKQLEVPTQYNAPVEAPQEVAEEVEQPEGNYNQESQNATSVKSETSNTNSSYNNNSAKEWIANKESGGSYSATNGQYVGRYQLSASYLNGDYSEANQEKVANQYVSSRYGSWEAAQSFWQANGWY